MTRPAPACLRARPVRSSQDRPPGTKPLHARLDRNRERFERLRRTCRCGEGLDGLAVGRPSSRTRASTPSERTSLLCDRGIRARSRPAPGPWRFHPRVRTPATLAGSPARARRAFVCRTGSVVNPVLASAGCDGHRESEGSAISAMAAVKRPVVRRWALRPVSRSQVERRRRVRSSTARATCHCSGAAAGVEVDHLRDGQPERRCPTEVWSHGHPPRRLAKPARRSAI